MSRVVTSDSVIDKVEKLAKRQNRKVCWRVRDRNNKEFGFDYATAEKGETADDTFLEKRRHIQICQQSL